MKRNSRGALAASGIILTCLVILGFGCGGRRSEQYTQEGTTYLRLGNVSEAAASYDRALSANPANVDAKVGRARCYVFTKEPDKAIAAFKEAIAMNPKLSAAYVEAVRVCLAKKDVETAEALARQFESVDAEASGILRASILREQGKSQEAIDLLASLRKKFDRSAEVRLNLATAYLAEHKPEDAEKELNSVLSDLDQESLPAHMLLVDVYQAEGKIDQMVTQLRDLCARRPDDKNLSLSLARSLLAAGKYDEAESIARPILEQTPESAWANFVVGACLLQKGQFSEAVECLQAAVAGLPQQKQVADLLAAAQRGSKTPTATTSASAHAPASTIPGQETWHELWTDARLRELLDRRTTFLAQPEENLNETLTLAALCLDNVSLAQQLASALSAEAPLRRLVEAVAKRDAAAIKNVVDTWNETANEPRLIQLNAKGYVLALVGQRALAIGAFSDCIQQFGDNGVAYFNTAVMYRAAGMPKFAVNALRELIAKHEKNTEARKMLFDVAMDSGLTKDARQFAESTYALFPSDPSALLNLARVYRSDGDVDLAVDVLKRGMQALPNAPVLAIACAEILAYRGDAAGSELLLGKVSSGSAYDTQINSILAYDAGMRSDWKSVLGRCEQLGTNKIPVAIRLLHTAALIQSGSGDKAAVLLLDSNGKPINNAAVRMALQALGKSVDSPLPPEAALAKSLASNPSALGAYAFAMACIEASFNPVAFAELQKLDATVSAQPLLVGPLLHALALSRGMKDRLAVAQKYTAKYASLGAAWIGQAEVCSSLDDKAGQESALKKAVEVAPKDPNALLARAQSLDEIKDAKELVALYRKLLALEPDDPYIANNLAYCALQSGENAEEILALAQKAAEKLPTNASVLHTLGLAQLRSGKLDEGRKNLRTALDMHPGDPTMLLDYGQTLIAAKEADEGKKCIQLALRYATQLGLDFPRRAEAEQAITGA